jgi:predicted HD phosphohydrolase
MYRTVAERFAEDWVAAWNSHDLGRILEHYEEDFEMSIGKTTPLFPQSVRHP